MIGKVKFANGLEYECNFVGQPKENIVFVTLCNTTYMEAASVFSNPSNLQTITYTKPDGSTENYNGFTVFEYLVNQKDGFRASLRIPYATEV